MKKLNKKVFYYLFLMVFVLLLTGCGTSGVVTPGTNNLSEDANICEKLLLGFYADLSNQNFTKALSYCKYGGLTYDYVYDAWDLAIKYPSLYATYQVHNVYNFSYLGANSLELYYDYSWTSNIKNSMNGRRMFFEKIDGKWKMF